MTKGSVVYIFPGPDGRPHKVGAWDGEGKMPIIAATRHADGRGWTLVWRDASGARIVGVHRGDNTFARVRSVTSREVS